MSSSNGRRLLWNVRVEQLSRAELLDLQEARLLSLLARVQATNPFYRERFARCGVDASRIRNLSEFRERVPCIGKADLIADQERAPPYGTRLAVPTSEVATVVLTSGTSGRGREVHCYSFADLERSTAQLGYLLRWEGLDPGDRFFHTIPVGMELGGVWYKRGAERFGLNYFNVAKYDTDSRIDHMLRFSPHFLMTSCSYLGRLEARCLERGIEPRKAFPDLKGVSIGGEPHSVDWARKMEDFWGAKLHERFGSTQSGGTHLMTCECGVQRNGRRQMMHNLGHKAIIEVLDPATGQQVESGEEGELVVTCLYMETFPAIRFRMGDRVRYMAHGECPCGRPFDGIECGTVSRLDDMIKIKSTNVWPNSVDAVVFAHADIAEYNGRVFIDDRGRETVQVGIEFLTTSELQADQRARLLRALRDELKSRTDVTMDVVEVPALSLPRFETKARRWLDERIKPSGAAH